MARVLIKGLTKRYGDVIAVNNLNLEARDREFVVFLGPSGCGKTTSLRCIAGLETIDEGEIHIGDTVVNDLEPKERNIAMVFQNYALYPHMTVYKNMYFPLENFGYSTQAAHKRIVEVAKLLQIVPLLDRKPTELSGGQQQRVALGRAIVREPKVFLMDEPLSNLDAKLRVHMRAELKKLQKDLGVTTIYVTHDQLEAMTMADRIAIMEQGILQQMDTPNSVYYHPNSLFVAGFIGTPPINFFECSHRRNGILDAGEFQYTLEGEMKDAAQRATSSEIVIGIRPQDVRVHEAPGASAGHIQSKLYTTEPLGEMTILDLKIGETLLKASVAADFKTEKEELWVEFPPDKVYLFDQRSGKALT